jgi:sugar fermentation stimulation protein A
MNTYLLKIYLEQTRKVRIGRLGTFTFARGFYWYVGSAKKNLKQRVARHRRKKKKLHWHIDYLLQHARITEIWTTDIREKDLAGILSERLAVPVVGFGASDAKTKAHLFYGEQDIQFTNIKKHVRLRSLLS